MLFGVEIMISYVENLIWYLECVREDLNELCLKERLVVDEFVIVGILVNGLIRFGNK